MNFQKYGFITVFAITLLMLGILANIFFSRPKISDQHDFEFETYKFTMITAPAGTTIYQIVTQPNTKTELEPVCMVKNPEGFSIERVGETQAKCKSEVAQTPPVPFELKH